MRIDLEYGSRIPKSKNRPRPTATQGVALVIVLAFVVLLATGLVIAFFSRSMSERQISNSSVNRSKVNAFADGATDAIIGELKQEILLGSATNTITTGTVTTAIYTPLAPVYMLRRSYPGPPASQPRVCSTLYNLLKVSSPAQLFFSGSNGSIPQSGVNNVAAVSSTISVTEWSFFIPELLESALSSAYLQLDRFDARDGVLRAPLMDPCCA